MHTKYSSNNWVADMGLRLKPMYAYVVLGKRGRHGRVNTCIFPNSLEYKVNGM